MNIKKKKIRTADKRTPGKYSKKAKATTKQKKRQINADFLRAHYKRDASRVSDLECDKKIGTLFLNRCRYVLTPDRPR